ncbi:MAG TPA: ATP-binding protein [Nocardioidaceae bacterium]|nr:ATP-binding protein [Nocardioidaceae bacterium]
MAEPVGPSRMLRDALLMGAAYGTVSFLVLEAVAFGYPTGAVFWPGAGLTLGVLLRRPRQTWPALLAGVFVAEVVVDLTIPVGLDAALVWAVANTVEPTVGAWLLTRRHRVVSLDSVHGLLRFLALGGALGPLVGATVGATAAWATGVDDFWPTWPRWWVGDAIGVVIVAPAIIVWRERPDVSRAPPPEGGWILGALASVIAVSLAPWPGDVWQQGLPYLIAPALVVVAMRLGPWAATVGVAITGLTVNAFTAAGIGPFAEYGVYGGLVVAQVCLAAAAFAGLIVMALSSDLVSLRELGEQRTAMANVLAHEVKNPLFAITGNAELLDANAPAELILSARAAIERGARRIGTTIEDMLALAQFDNPSAPRVLGQVDLAEIVSEVVELNAAAADRSGIELNVVLGGRPCFVSGVRDELDKMVLNLISNAVKYTPSGGSVSVTCSVEGDQAVLVCQDDGIGISAEDQARLFDEFFRSSDPAARARPGTGLGLSIVRRVVERHGGSITVDSAVGVGSTFTVRLPRDEGKSQSTFTRAAAPRSAR